MVGAILNGMALIAKYTQEAVIRETRTIPSSSYFFRVTGRTSQSPSLRIPLRGVSFTQIKGETTAFA